MVLVRPATSADADAIAAIGHAAWPATYGFAGADYVAHGLATWWSPDAVARGLSTTTTLVAEVDDDIVGMGNIDLRPAVPVIWKLYVLPSHQGRGVGSALLGGLVAAAPSDRRAVSIEYVDGNVRAAAVYARHGFVEVRREAAERAGWPEQVWAELDLGG
jgi:GNAT superfamily N-acetyltransferase